MRPLEEKTVVILGATGSIGSQACEVLRRLEGFRLVGFSFGSNVRAARNIVGEFGRLPYYSHSGLELSDGVRVSSLRELLERTRPDVTLCAVPGFEGVKATLTAIEFSRRIALATKEALVCAAPFVKRKLREFNVELVPVDSEHSALFQIMEPGVEKVIITASGGAVRNLPLENLWSLTPDEVLRHPTWSMGGRITVDSSTMVNKFFEVVEAHELFDIPFDRIEVTVNPSSFVHGIVFLRDGTVKVHAGRPDMRVPIAYALTYPQRIYKSEPSAVENFDFTLAPLQEERYPLFFFGVRHAANDLALRVALNAADEVAVEWFLKRRITFGTIAKVVMEAVERVGDAGWEGKALVAFEEVCELDEFARLVTVELLKRELGQESKGLEGGLA